MGSLHKLGPKDREDWTTGKLTGEWIEITQVVDSGAVDTVLNRRAAAVCGLTVKENEYSRRGCHYATATNEPIPVEGECVAEGFTDDGVPVMQPFMVAEVCNPLLSVRQLKKGGSITAFGLDDEHAIINRRTGKVIHTGSDDVIIDKSTGMKTKIRDTGKEYQISTWVRKPDNSQSQAKYRGRFQHLSKDDDEPESTFPGRP